MAFGNQELVRLAEIEPTTSTSLVAGEIPVCMRRLDELQSGVPRHPGL